MICDTKETSCKLHNRRNCLIEHNLRHTISENRFVTAVNRPGRNKLVPTSMSNGKRAFADKRRRRFFS